MNMIEVKEISKAYENNEILSKITLKVLKGEFVVVMGRSGCGKSTLLYCISGMDQPDKGSILLDGQEITTMGEKDMEKIRLKKMGFIFQKTSFLKKLSIEDNIIFPAFQMGQLPRTKIVKEAEAMMKRMGISEIADMDVHKVSGGQLQRAAICRAMINHPDILFGDEPTGALNSAATCEVMNLLNGINAECNTTVLIVSHDSRVAARADRVFYIEDGNLKDECVLGKYQEKNSREREELVQKWLGQMNF